MPRVNPNRTLTNERNLAKRVEFERRKRQMSTDGLAKRMSALGLPMQKTTVFKIENETRRITVDELVGFATVFELELTDMLTPAHVVLDRAITDAVKKLVSEIDDARYHACKIVAAVRELAQHKGVNSELDSMLADLRRAPNKIDSDWTLSLPDSCVAPFTRLVGALWRAGETNGAA